MSCRSSAARQRAAFRFPGFDDAFIDLSVKGDLLKRVALIIRAGQDLTVRHGGGLSETVTGRFALALRHGSPASEPKTLLSFPGGVGIQAEQVYLQAGVEKFSDRPAESFAEFGMLGGRVSFSMDDADSFLSEAVAQKKVEAPFDFRVGWNRDGVHFHGSSGLSVSLPAHIEAGPFTVDSVTLGLGVKDTGLAIESSVSGHVSLGPLVATVQRIGLNVNVSFESGNIGIFDLSPHFKAPEGLGLSVEGGGFTGGGFLGFEPEAGRYSGMLELAFQDQFTLKAFGLLDTRLPSGEPGFSLVIVISSEFTPIPLGFGFSLAGVGGLLGLHRTVNVERLASGLGDQTLQSVLFPTDLVANADRILSDLRQVFPPARGRFVFGPLAKITWGTPALLTAEVGLVLEVPEPVRLVLLGVVRAILPDEQAAILRLEVHFLGVIDLAAARLAFDATLVDSRLLAFTLTGDLALRLYWGADANFLVTVGGFHPAYQPPPLGLPALHRLTIALVAGENPRLTLETYLAVTANTVQFGARLELYAAAWKFNAYGFLTFDVLFQFNPFYFVADVTAMLALRVGSSAIASIKLTLTLEGPTPWKAKGDARLKLCWFLTVKIRFSKTFGEARQTTLPDVAVLPGLTAALAARDTWREALPANGQRLESLRALPVDASAPVRVHPVGTVAISQTVVPLGIAIDRIGAQRPADGPTYAIADVVVGGDAAGGAAGDGGGVRAGAVFRPERCRQAGEPVVQGASRAACGSATPTGGAPATPPRARSATNSNTSMPSATRDSGSPDHEVCSRLTQARSTRGRFRARPPSRCCRSRDAANPRSLLLRLASFRSRLRSYIRRLSRCSIRTACWAPSRPRCSGATRSSRPILPSATRCRSSPSSK